MKRPVLLILAAAPLLAAAVDYAAEGNLWWAHIQFLADDKLEGRNVGTEGFHKAVEYVSTQFERYGLKPAGTSGYLQPVKFETRTLVAEESSIALVRDGNVEPLVLGTDATLNARAGAADTLEAPMVFVGYGMVIPEAHYDDLAGLDMHGKIAVYVNGPGPADAPGPLKSHYSSAVERWAALRKAGAVGLATIQNPRMPAPGGAGAEGAAGRGGRGRGGAARGGRGPAQPVFGLGRPGATGDHRAGGRHRYQCAGRRKILCGERPYLRGDSEAGEGQCAASQVPAGGLAAGEDCGEDAIRSKNRTWWGCCRVPMPG